MSTHERRVLARIGDEIRRYRDGRLATTDLLNRVWGLYQAAEVREPQTRETFEELYYRLSSADDARQPWMPPGIGSDEEVEAAVVALERWAETAPTAPDSTEGDVHG